MLASATPKATMNFANKRRRLNDNAEILSKPFRSPLKVNNKQARSSAHDTDDDKNEVHSPTSPHEKQYPVDNVKNSATAQETALSPCKDEDVIQLQREYAALCQQVKSRRQNVDILQRALIIRTSNQQAKLNKLIIKWRDIAREVADDVYVSASAQVKDMGGLQSMRSRSHEFAAECSDVNKDRPFARSDSVADTEHDQSQSEAEETEFNMAIMLHQLNIDPDLLGFDPETDGWRG